MKTKLVLFFIIISNAIFAQTSVNDYAAVVVPTKFDFLRAENEYRMATITKYNLEKAGFKAVYSNSDFSVEFPNRCSLLMVDVVKDSGFLTTKLFIELKDCYGKVIFTSEIGKSKEKDFGVAYKEALENAFESVFKLEYKYNGKFEANTIADNTKVQAVTLPQQSTVVSSVITNSNNEVLYAQPTENGFQLIDKTPKVVMKLMKTGTPNSFIAIKGDVQGVLNLKDNQWVFDSYQNGTLVSEVITVKF
ncbi:hypothetical protein SLW70_00860 [Flavobacterium sp. NG2]|uniref:hypothetical protein n=1 Tax=Flavobacterium sp. NG2 TaxID=3097547 RepID=UPI002A7F6A4B|nr:hypothetical protein [Flavobacterium sp. NG2]WPR71710.1 hypothetical protein SLW70_00860 [Flavobacterium sp. NG2]